MLHIDKLPSIEELRLRASEEIIKFDDTHFETVGTYLLVHDMLESTNVKENEEHWEEVCQFEEDMLSLDDIDEEDEWLTYNEVDRDW